ncbi:MAG: thioredoxin family protein [Pseudomonadota bacterium]
MEHVSRRIVLSGAAVSVAFPTWSVAAELTPKHGFNDAEIEWYLFNDGLARARVTGQPILFLAHTTWCPHCARYKTLFFDREIVNLMKGYTAVLVDRDQQPDLNDRFAPEGRYIPRTMVLQSDGTHMPGVTGPNPQFRFFIPYDGPEALADFLRAGLRDSES